MQCARSLHKNLDYSSWLARERFSATNKVINKISTKSGGYMQTSTRSNPVSRPSQSRPSDAIVQFTRFCCCCYSKGTKLFSKTRGASKLSLTWRSHTLACSQPSRQHHRTPPARNSAFVLISSLALVLRGSVLSWARPSPPTTRISMDEQTSARKMVT